MFGYIMKNNLLKDIKSVYVVVSHTHSDHCGSLGSFGLYCQFVLKEKLKIVVPHSEEYVQHLKHLMHTFGNTDKAFEFVYEEELDYKFKNFNKVRYDLTKHDYMLTSYSFIFESDRGDIFFSADTRVADNLLRFIETHKNIDKMFMEVTDLNTPDDIHMNLDRLVAVLPESVKSKIYMMHFRNDQCKEKVKNYGFHIVDVGVKLC